MKRAEGGTSSQRDATAEPAPGATRNPAPEQIQGQTQEPGEEVARQGSGSGLLLDMRLHRLGCADPKGKGFSFYEHKDATGAARACLGTPPVAAPEASSQGQLPSDGLDSSPSPALLSPPPAVPARSEHHANSQIKFTNLKELVEEIQAGTRKPLLLLGLVSWLSRTDLSCVHRIGSKSGLPRGYGWVGAIPGHRCEGSCLGAGAPALSSPLGSASRQSSAVTQKQRCSCESQGEEHRWQPAGRDGGADAAAAF